MDHSKINRHHDQIVVAIGELQRALDASTGECWGAERRMLRDHLHEGATSDPEPIRRMLFAACAETL